MAYEQIVGPVLVGRRLDVLVAMLAATVSNRLRGKKENARPIQDFMVAWGGREEQTVDEMVAIARSVTATLDGSV